jgi:flagellar hook assembly protein FlgD
MILKVWAVHTYSAFYSSGNESEIVTIEAFVESEETSIPVITKLSGNYPNPFNPVTNISFSIKEASQVTIDIYNLKGEKVNTLVNEYLEPNYYNVEWNGRDENNRSVASGVYFYKMKAGRYTSTKKMILMK